MRKYKTKPKIVTKEQRVTFTKRKRGILKKCIEVSEICGQDVFMVILDRKSKRIVELNSTPDFNLQAVTSAMEDHEKNGMEHAKFYNVDLPLLIKNTTPY